MQRAGLILDELHCPYVVNQNKYNIFDRTIERNGLKDYAAQMGKGILAFSPLEQGLLTNRYLNGIPTDSRIRTDGRFLTGQALYPKRVAQLRQLNELAQQRGESLAQMALRWILRDGVVTGVLIGVSRPEQMADNIQIVHGAPLTQEELECIDAIVFEEEIK